MAQLNKLPKIIKNKKKRLGRGYGSGKGGHTVGRGQKGQKSRSKIGPLFEGTKVRKSLIKRLPMMRGKNKFKSLKSKQIIINVKFLNLLKDNSEVTVESLIKNNIFDKKVRTCEVKVLGDGELKKSLIVKLPVSKGAKEKIEKAGGKVIEINKVKKQDKVKNEEKKTKKAQRKTKGEEKKK